MKTPALITAMAFLGFSTLVSADEIYRCGPNGTAYSQTPCSNGARIEMSDVRTEQQRSDALLLAAKTEAWGTALERDRLATEAAYRPPLAGSLNASTQRASEEKPRPASKVKRKRLKSKPVDSLQVPAGRPSPRSGNRR